MVVETNQALADALSKAMASARNSVLKGVDLPRRVRERLMESGCLTEIIKGWYILSKPGTSGATTTWFGGFWAFISAYLEDRFGADGYCLSAESSVDLVVGANITRQIVAVTKKASNQTIDLPHDTSLLMYLETNPEKFPSKMETSSGVNVMPLPTALCRLSPAYFRSRPLEVEIGLKILPSVTDLSRALLNEGAATSAGRIAGALQTLDMSEWSEQIIKDMAAAGYRVIVENPFEGQQPQLSSSRLVSPYAGRIEAMWKAMRQDVISVFPGLPTPPMDRTRTLSFIQEIYKQDAYHSLSIEGYQVTEQLIQQIANGDWQPDEADRGQRDALAAKGYSLAFQSVVGSLNKAFEGESPGRVFARELQTWYRNLFSPSVQAGILNAADLAGYRNNPVFIDGARHVPPGPHAVLDSMETFFGLLNSETEPSVRAVLGHFIFVFIHPYMDGNGRIGRFLMNLMLVSGGYPWTIIRTPKRPEYMRALEDASSGRDIKPFTRFVASEMTYWQHYAAEHG